MRGYASESSPNAGGGGGSRVLAYSTIGLATAGGLGWYFNRSSAPKTIAPLQPGDKVFKGGDQGFIALKLENIETISPNTKKFRFAFPEANDVSGLPIACELQRDSYQALRKH